MRCADAAAPHAGHRLRKQAPCNSTHFREGRHLQADRIDKASLQHSASTTAEGGEFTRGWTILLASLIGIGSGLVTLPFYTFGIFAPHLARDFGWSMGEIMAGLTITTLALLVAAPVAGVLCERYGARLVSACSLALFGLCYISLATLDGSLTQYYVTWGVASAVGAGTLPITFTRTVNRWFDRHRGLALGIAMMGTGLFGIACKPLLAWVITDYGWRTAYAALGALPLLVATPVTLLLFRDPTDADVRSASTPLTPLTGFSRSEALRQWRFWLIALLLIPLSFALAGTPPNLESILSDKGLDPATIIKLTPLVGLASITGRLAGGFLLDRFWAPAVAFVILSVPIASCLILSGGNLQPATAGFAIFLIGFALGVEFDVVAYLTAKYFGMRSYSAIYGLFYVCFTVGAGFAPLAFGMIRDTAHDFSPALLTCAIILPISAAGFLFLGRYPRFS
ncbi:MFS transporter [Novosphingobium sp. P6W]|nr:MFS transporter [Novosphingobium sp. P6W]